MTIFAITPLSPVTPSTPVNRADAAADLARVAIIQTTEALGAMIGQSTSDDVALSGREAAGKDTVGEGEQARTKAAEARAPLSPEAQAEAPAKAVAVAAGRAAARQAGLAPLMADMAQAADAPEVPDKVKAAIAQVMALGARVDGQISGPEIRQALQRSGLFLEARLASAPPADEVQRSPTGTLTAPPKVIPTPTPNSDMKAALLVFREVVKTWMDGAAPAQVAAQPQATPDPAATAAASSAQAADRGTPQALTVAASQVAHDDEAPAAAAPAEPEGDAAPAPVRQPTVPARTTSPSLPAFGAILAEDFQDPAPLPTTLAALRAPLAGVAAYAGPEAAPAPPSETPPPYAGAPTHAQPAARATLPAGADAHLIGQRLLHETGAALARTELLQIASLPDPQAPDHPVEDKGARWVFDMPFMTPQGPAAAQFEISRDGGGSGGEGGRPGERTWRARFSLDVEPMGPVHAQVALTGDVARVSLWAERPASMARLRDGEERLSSALREAALEPEVAFHAGQPRAPAVGPGQFLDQAT